MKKRAEKGVKDLPIEDHTVSRDEGSSQSRHNKFGGTGLKRPILHETLIQNFTSRNSCCATWNEEEIFRIWLERSYESRKRLQTWKKQG